MKSTVKGEWVTGPEYDGFLLRHWNPQARVCPGFKIPHTSF